MAAASALQAQRTRNPNWKPKLGVLCEFSDQNLEFVKAEGFTSMELMLDPNRLDDAAVRAIGDKIQRSGIHVSSLGVNGNHIDPDPAARERQNKYTAKCIELCGQLGIQNIGGQSGTIKGRPLKQQVDEIVRVYSEKYFALCEKHKVRILWEPWAGGPNIATGPVAWELLFKAFNDSPNVGLQFDPSHLQWQFMDPIQAARDFVDKIYDIHLKGHRNPLAYRAARRHPTRGQCALVAFPPAWKWVGRLERPVLCFGGGRLLRRNEHRE